jgi:hypothetical protein
MPAFRRSANRKLSPDRDGEVISTRSAIAVPLGARATIAVRDVRRAEIPTVDARYSMGIVQLLNGRSRSAVAPVRRAACSMRPEKPF